MMKMKMLLFTPTVKFLTDNQSIGHGLALVAFTIIFLALLFHRQR